VPQPAAGEPAARVEPPRLGEESAEARVAGLDLLAAGVEAGREIEPPAKGKRGVDPFLAQLGGRGARREGGRAARADLDDGEFLRRPSEEGLRVRQRTAHGHALQRHTIGVG